jgi:hypothetical protein
MIRKIFYVTYQYILLLLILLLLESLERLFIDLLINTLFCKGFGLSPLVDKQNRDIRE